MTKLQEQISNQLALQNKLKQLTIEYDRAFADSAKNIAAVHEGVGGKPFLYDNAVWKFEDTRHGNTLVLDLSISLVAK